jgi:hypothetical protein
MVYEMLTAEPPSTFSLQSMQRQYLLLQDRAIAGGGAGSGGSGGGVGSGGSGGGAGGGVSAGGTGGSHLSCALLLRMLLGPEVGMLRDPTSAQCVLDALTPLSPLYPLSQTQSSATAISAMEQEREVRAEALKLALVSNGQSSTGQSRAE